MVVASLIDRKTQCIYRIEGTRGGSFHQLVSRFSSSKRSASGVRCRIHVGRLPATEIEWEIIEGWLTSVKRPDRSSKSYRLTGILQCIQWADDKSRMILVRFNGTYPASEEVKVGLLRPEKDEIS